MVDTLEASILYASQISPNVKDREACLLSILDNIQDAIFSVDHNLHIITANRVFRERTFTFTGIDFKPGDSMLVKGRNQHILDPTIEYLKRAMLGETFKVDTEYHVDKKVIYRESSFAPLIQDGEIIGASCYSKDVSDSKQFKKMLDEKEDLFQNLLENSHDGIVMVGVHGGLKYISPSVRRILGYDKDKTPEFWEMVHPEDRSAVKTLTDYLEPRFGETGRIVCRALTKHGDIRWIHCNITNMLHEPSIMAFVGNYEDITDRYELQVELEDTVHRLIEADERQTSIINSLGANIALLNQHGVIVVVNEAWKRFSGDNQLVSENYRIGDNYIELAEQATCDGETTGRDVANGILDVLSEKKDTFSLEYTCHSGTERRWFKMIVYPLYKKSRGGVVVYHVDITDRKQIELQIEFDRRNQEALINSTDDLMWSLDPQMRLITANNQFLAITKAAPAEQLLPSKLLLPSEAYATDEVTFWIERYKRVLAGERFTEIVMREQPFEYWAEILFNPIFEGEKVIGAACYSRNITDRKKSERQLLQSQQMMSDAESIAHFGSWECDLLDLENFAGNNLRWSNEVFRIFGYEPGLHEVSYENFFNAIHPDDKEQIRWTVQKALTETSCYSTDHRIVRPNGEIRWVHEEAKIMFDETKATPIKMVGTVLDITERKNAEESVRISNERYELVTKATNDAIWDWNLVTDKVYWSEGYENLFGYPRTSNQSSAEIWTKRVHPGDVERIRASVLEAINNPSSHSWQGEYRYVTYDGSTAYVYDRGYIIYGEDGKPIRMVGAMQDITEKKKAEAALRKRTFELNERVKELDCLYKVSIIVNSSGDSIQEMLQHCTALIPTAYQYPEITCARITLEGQAFATSNFKETRWRQSSDITIQGACVGIIEVFYLEGKPEGYNGPFLKEELSLLNSISRNISMSLERKRAEESLHESEANLRTIFDHADRAFTLLDKNFRILSFNSMANEWAKLAYEQEFEEGRSMIDYLEKGKQEEGVLVLQSVLEGHIDNHEVNYAMPGGDMKWVSVRRYPVRNKNGDILGICIATKDITKRKNYEIERDRMTAELMQRNKDLEQFAYIVSHNLRAPVANIIGFSDILLHTDLTDDETREVMNGLDISIRRLDDVIIDLNNILQVKKVSELKQPVRFSKLVEDIVLSINSTIEKEQVSIKTDFDQVDETNTIKSYLHSIFYNLITNSIKYRKKELQPVLEIKSRRVGDKLELCFKDNGLGIDLNRRNEQVFGLYKRFHTHVAEGKGMGLFMVKMQVETLGGKISINSEVNVGTEFTIVFDC